MGISFGCFKKFFAVGVTMLTLTACGGGGGGGGGSPNPPPAPPAAGPTQDDLNSASFGKLAAVFKPESREVVLRWNDSFTTESGYRVERQTDGATWQLQEALAATPSSGTMYTWTRVTDTSATYRVVAQRDGYVVPLQTERGQSSIQIDLAAATPQLVLDQQPPVRETVQLSVTGATGALSVLYFVDGDGFIDSIAGPTFPVTWNSRTRTDGNHVLYANVNYANGLTIQLPPRTVEVDNPSVAVQFILPFHQPTNQINIRALARSDFGVRQVEFFVNGASVVVLTTPVITDTWEYLYDTSGLPSGPATFRAVATDNNGEQAEVTRQVEITHAPVVTLNTPDGGIFRGTLAVYGLVTDDLPGTVVTAFLGGVQLFEISAGPLGQDVSLAAFAPGPYTLRVQARDTGGLVTTVERTIIVTAVTAFSHERIATGTSPLSLLDTDGGDLIYRRSNGQVRYRAAIGSEVQVINTALINNPQDSVDARLGGQWHLSDGYITTAGSGLVHSPAIYLWDPSGTQSEFAYTLQAGEFPNFLRSELYGSWLVWGSNRSLYLRNLAVQAPDIGPISASKYGHAFVTASGQLFFVRETVQQPNSALDLFVYDVALGSTTPVTAGAGTTYHIRPKADSTRVAWESLPSSGNVNGPTFELRDAPVSNPTANVVRSTTMTKFELEDGLLAWTENLSNAVALKVHDGTTETLVSHTASTMLYSTSDGAVVFSELGRLYIWNAALGKRLLLEVLPTQVIQGDNEMYLTTGGSAETTIHRTTY